MGRETWSHYLGRLRVKQLARDLAELPLRQREANVAGRVVALWNGRLARGAEPLFVPTIGAAIRGGMPFLSYQCPGCQQIGDVDLRTVDRHPGASLESLIPDLDCTRCSPHPPFARLVGLSAGR